MVTSGVVSGYLDLLTGMLWEVFPLIIIALDNTGQNRLKVVCFGL